MKKQLTILLLLFCLALPAQAQFFSAVATPIEPTINGALALGDLDGDGRLDVITGGSNEAGLRVPTRVYRNAGSAGLDAWAFSEVRSLELHGATSIDVGDMDNDGDLDLLVTGPLFPTLPSGTAIFRNDGDFNFSRLSVDLPATPQVVLEVINTSTAAWGDYDSDGDLDILFTSKDLSRIYRNDGSGVFSPVQDVGLPVVKGGSVDWGDYNNDGLLDLLVATEQPGPSAMGTTQVYKNNAGVSFTAVADLPATSGFESGSAKWGDYDNDGRLDVLFVADQLAKVTDPDVRAGVYSNQGGDAFASNPIALPTAFYAEGIDYDNNGRLDVLLDRTELASGEQSSKTATTQTFIKFFRNDGSGLIETDGEVPGIRFGAIATGDLDGDATPDVLAIGTLEAEGRSSASTFSFYRNVTNAVANQRPAPPTGLTSSRNGSDLILEWDPAQDPDNPQALLTYNVRVGTTRGGADIVTPMSLSDGTRLLPRNGNAGHATRFVVRNLDPTLSYFWSVQSVDAGYAGSEFVAEAVSVDTEDAAAVPGQVTLLGNYPNPFKGSTAIRYALPASTPVRLTVYNVLGAEVAVLVEETMPAGTHESTWNGRNLIGNAVPSGLYMYRLEAGDVSTSRTMVLLK